MLTLDGRTVMISGANRGIGAALTARFQSGGAQVTGTSRKDGPHRLDVCKPEDHAAFARNLNGAPIDLLVCNAGVYLDKGARIGSGYEPDIWAASFAANVTGVYLTVENLMDNLKAATTPKIAIISSQMASHTRAPGGSYVYRASKAAALNLGRNLATDLKPLGIAVGIYHPGWVRTDMGGSAADISVDQAADGLYDRFMSLSLETTGCFQTWDGADHPF
jgi:NAD(P)-dependent dehydrogenase (short-subunit alcohol dehydrogenase family)